MIVNSVKNRLQNGFIKKLYYKIFNFYNSIETIYPKELKFDNNNKILILAPHADDEVIGCGGLLLKYSKQCDVICLTDGRYGDRDIDIHNMIKIRKNEFISVMTKLNIKNFNFLEIEDTKLKYNYEVLNQISFNNYDYICIPNNLDQHPDHKVVFNHIQQAYKDKLIKKNIKIIMYEIWGTLPIVNYYIDISHIVQQKKEIINLYHSQIKYIDYATKILALNEYRGMIANKKYVEGYFIINIRDLIK